LSVKLTELPHDDNMREEMNSSSMGFFITSVDLRS
jgi:hypothetical protein